MPRLVYNCFKGILLAIIFVFVWDMGFFLFRVMNLNQRMLLLTSSMVKTVQANNYMPEDMAQTYKTMLEDIGVTMNGSGGDETFIAGFNWNYDSHASLGKDKTNLNLGTNLHTKMSEPADYGDIMEVHVNAYVYQPFWSFATRGDTFTSTRDARAHQVALTYRYLVPCLHYTKQGVSK